MTRTLLEKLIELCLLLDSDKYNISRAHLGKRITQFIKCIGTVLVYMRCNFINS